MKTYFRYLLREMVLPFGAGFLFFVALILAHTLIKLEEAGLLSSRAVPPRALLEWLLYRVPLIAVYAFPVATLLAVSLTVIRLARDRELTALRIGGLSLTAALSPLWTAALFLSGLAFLNAEYVVPWAGERSVEVFREAILRQPRILMKQNVPFRGDVDTFFHIRDVDVRHRTLYHVLIYRLQPGRIQEVLIAERAEQEGGRWYLKRGHRHLFNSRNEHQASFPFERWPIDLRRDLEKYWVQEDLPEQMSARELGELIRIQREAGQPVAELLVHYHSKFSLPLACLVCALLAAPLSLRDAPTGVFTGLVLTIVILFFYNGWVNWSKVLGMNHILSPWLAAWSHDLVFGGLGIGLLWWAERA